MSGLRRGRPVAVSIRLRRPGSGHANEIESVTRVARRPATPDPGWAKPSPDPGTSWAPWRLYNVGHGHQASVNELIALLEKLLGRRAERRWIPEQPGEVPATHADTADLAAHIDFTPSVSLEEGMARFARWFLDYRGRATPPAPEAAARG
jgi:UDP-glucuronate 4-epimerase